MDANVGINILSFLIMWGFELYLKFAQGGGDIEKPRKFKSKNESGSENLPNQNSETEITETALNAKLKQKQKAKINSEAKAKTKTETFDHQDFQPNSEKINSKINAETKPETDSKTATILKLETQFFPYEKHVRNARQSFKRAFDKSRKPNTIQNRMATAQQHINALLFEGFNVWIEANEPTLLRVDKLNQPSLKPQHWEALVEMKNGSPHLEKFEFDEAILGEAG